jgi:hypothetical protein
MSVVRLLYRSTLIVLRLFVALGVVALTLFWALAPAVTSVDFLSDGNDAGPIRNLWPIHLVPPEFVFYFYGPSLAYWTFAETIARLILVILAWPAVAFLVYRKYARGRAMRGGGAFEVIIKP